MTRPVLISPQARDDLAEHFAFIGKDRLEAAERFLAAAEQLFNQLGRTPKLGRPRRYSSPRLSGLRSFAVPGFRNHLVFYRVTEEGVEVVRVLHGSRDIRRALEE